MVRADERAQQQGTAGAWAAVLLALVGATLSAIVLHRLRRLVAEPLVEIEDAVRAVREGDPHRRCTVGDAAPEIRHVARAINELLDRRRRRHQSHRPSLWSQLDRLALVRVLDQRPRPTFSVDDEGTLHATNRAADELLETPPGRELLEEAPGARGALG